ncbi:AAA family ATPase [Oenococcus kitaharae]|uniref:NadR family nicotinamide-nucleotide adenylyltransferase n=1 Tax=Oenococcus kitaharae DSM 17330 TaxID=1045004 RepID=G9WG54_9LACO|nr:AAA family ATPase [Oenococcus kitaharae]EHN59632.1 NadR family nicotinamide-nucleotide adenylyltransferase [Oenococcus kitaharae DSM 17330]OEY83476.1 adenylyltransferase [Oenococcus kitaharae]OEY85275.1 adenylyltransferase [Oenococcus kitaharae]OEY86129.1 adenylyltransferase [Oenococcus kitaharae]
MNYVTNLKKEDLAGDRIGVFFGTFAPLHVGHQAEIYKAAALNDGVLVVTSGYTGDRGEKIGLPLRKRFRYLRQAFADEWQIKVDYLDEDNMPKMPNGWDVWLAKLIAIVKRNIVNKDAKIIFYTGEQDYKDEIEKRLGDDPQYSVSLMDRTILNISATKIRQDPLKYWDFINRVFRRHFVQKVVVMGGANSGKSTLIRRLARSANSPFSDDFAEIYQEASNVADSEMDIKDYLNIIQGQYQANSTEINSPANNGLAIFNGDAISLQAYSNLLLNEDEREQLEHLYNTTISAEEIDLILVIPPFSDQRRTIIRATGAAVDPIKYHRELLRLINQYGFADKLVVLDAKNQPNDPAGYYARYLQALDAIQAYTGFDIEHRR